MLIDCGLSDTPSQCHLFRSFSSSSNLLTTWPAATATATAALKVKKEKETKKKTSPASVKGSGNANNVVELGEEMEVGEALEEAEIVEGKWSSLFDCLFDWLILNKHNHDEKRDSLKNYRSNVSHYSIVTREFIVYKWIGVGFPIDLNDQPQLSPLWRFRSVGYSLVS